MLDTILIIVLTLGFLIGIKRGFIMEVIHITRYIIAYIAASIYYDELALKLRLWIPYPNFDNHTTFKLLADNGNMETAFYRAVAFVLIFIAVIILLRIIGRMLNVMAHLPILKQVNVLAGGALGFCEAYLLLFILLYIAAFVPITAVQNLLEHSSLAKTIVNHTPILSQQLKHL